MINAILLTVLSISLGAVLHDIYINLHGVKYKVGKWNVIVRGDFLDTKMTLDAESDNEKLNVTLDTDSMDIDYAKSN
jgi:hypothetical protein